MFARHVRRSALPLLALVIGGGVFVAVPSAEAGTWQLVETMAAGPIDGRCVPGEAVVQGGHWKIFAAGPTSIEVGRYVDWEPTAYWTHHRIALPPLPARLDPGQRVQWPLAIEVSAGHPKVDSTAWIYRIGGEGDRLAMINATTTKQVMSKVHVVPDGPAGPTSRLTFQTGGGWSGGFTCTFTYNYQWTDQGAARTPPTTDPVAVPTHEPTPAADPSIEENIDRIGSNYRRLVAVRSAAECRQMCAAEAPCLAYTWVQAGIQGPNPVCYLKNSIPPATPSLCCISGRK